MAGVIIFVNWLKASISTLFPSGVLTMDAWPISSGWNTKERRLMSKVSQSLQEKLKQHVNVLLYYENSIKLSITLWNEFKVKMKCVKRSWLNTIMEELESSEVVDSWADNNSPGQYDVKMWMGTHHYRHVALICLLHFIKCVTHVNVNCIKHMLKRQYITLIFVVLTLVSFTPAALWSEV